MKTNEIVMPGMQMKKLISNKYEPILQKYDLRPVEVDILVFLHETEDIDTAKEIIQCKHLSKAHVSKSIDNLKERGFIQIIEDDEDHRILHICLTDKSKEVIDIAMKVYEECKEIMQRGISKEEMEVVKRVMTKVAENINQELEQYYS